MQRLPGGGQRTRIDGVGGYSNFRKQRRSRLNRRGRRSGTGCSFTALIVGRIRRIYGLRSRRDRLRDAGMLSLSEMAHALGVSTKTIKIWRDHGLLRAHAYNDKNECLYEPVDANGPVKSQGTKLSERRRFPGFIPDRTNEVQHAT